MSKEQPPKPAGQDKPGRVMNRQGQALHGSDVALPNDRQFINEAANESQKPIVALKTADTVPPPPPKE
jgi:hypothetical protein